jgi:hypothetical protein
VRITITTGPARRKPQVGDRKLIGGVVHVRKLKHCRDAYGRVIGVDKTNGRYHYEWVPVVTKGQEQC